MIKKLIYFVGLVILSNACTEKIDVKLDSTYARLVVDGTMDSDVWLSRVTLTKSADYFSNTEVPRVVNANVYLSDGSNNFPMKESVEGISGIYETVDPSFYGEVGKTYTLHVELAEPIADISTYEASSKLNSVTHLDSIATEFHPEWGPEGIWAIKLWAQEPGDEVNYYLFNIYKNGTLITDTISKKVVSDDMFFNGSYMNGVDVAFLNNANSWETIKPGDVVTLQMSGITKEYYDFINQVRQAGFSIPFFSGPPANVQGNINNGGIGFFTAWSSSYATTTVK